jgi:hypothetical protein
MRVHLCYDLPPWDMPKLVTMRRGRERRLVVRGLLLLLALCGGCMPKPDVTMTVAGTQASYDVRDSIIPSNRRFVESPVKGSRLPDGGCRFAFYRLDPSYVLYLAQYAKEHCEGRVIAVENAADSREAMVKPEVAASRPETQFINFDYAEVKDLGEHFLTLVAGVLVFSITFSEKIVDFPKAMPTIRYRLYGAWGAFVGAIIFSGLALGLIFLGGMIARQSTALVITDNAHSAYIWWEYWSLLAMLTAGITFVIGLLLLLASGVATLHARSISAEQTPQGANG